jgi:hypothetical protein
VEEEKKAEEGEEGVWSLIPMLPINVAPGRSDGDACALFFGGVMESLIIM